MLEIAAIKSSLLSSLMTGVMSAVSPGYVQLDTTALAADNCTHLCIIANTPAEAMNTVESGDSSYNVGNMW
jgi:hypothetical protein